MPGLIVNQTKKNSSIFIIVGILFAIYVLYHCYAQEIVNQSPQKHMVIIVPSYNNSAWYKKNLDSLINQHYSNFHIAYIDDCSSDGTGELVERYIKELNVQDKITLIKNKERKGALENLYNTIHACPDDAIIITVDGDDWLKHEHVLTRLDQEYKKNQVWMTYGQFEFDSTGKLGICRPISSTVIENNSFRKSAWYSSHLRTFYAWLFKSIKKEDLQYNGNFFNVTWDMAFMFPMLEMAAHRYACINDVLYVYNDNNPLCDHALRREQQTFFDHYIRNKTVYSPINSADCLIFSFDRPLQLYALLESMQKYVTGLDTISVLYRTSNKEFESAYAQLQEQFPTITFILQGNDPKADFKQLMLDTIYKSNNEYILFAVDDIIVKDFCDIRRCIALLQHHNAYGFYLRLGKNIARYDEELNQPEVQLTQLCEDAYSWTFKNSPKEWRYANTVDMTLYNKNTIKNDLLNMHYCAPNSFEAAWSERIHLYEKGICFNDSKIINIPLNRVQKEFNNYSMNLYTAKELLDEFNKGFKFDIAPLHKIANKYPHTEYKPSFVVR